MAKTLFLGVEGSGKTTLAMALVKAFAKHRGEGWYLRPVDRGAYNFATIAPEDFDRDGFPRQTANVREMTWRIERDGEGTGSLEIPDYPGEVYRLAFLNADDEPDPVAFRERVQANEQEIETLRAALANAGAVFVLFNLQDALDLTSNDANRGAIWVTNESLKAVKNLPSKPKVTLVFTQVDRYQTADDFLHSFKPADLDLIGHDHPDIDWTMVSVLVPPESEFGVDAFVRRCTGLADFGVPTGRPVNVEAQRQGEALRRLAAVQKGGASEKNETRTPNTPVPGPSATKLPVTTSHTVAVLAAVASLIVVLFVVGLSGFFFLWTRKMPQPVAIPQIVVTNTPALVVTNAPLPKDDGVKVEPTDKQSGQGAPALTEGTDGIRERQGEGALTTTNLPPQVKSAVTNTPVQDVVTNVASVKSQAMATRLATAAWSAWVKAEADRLRRVEEAEARLKAARASATPQEAHDALCDAAEAGNAEAQYLLARVYDFWGWGGFVRTPEERTKSWLEWSRRIDFEKGATAVAVSRPAPNADEFRRLALDWYRTASANGVVAADEALKKHEALAARKAEAAK